MYLKSLRDVVGRDKHNFSALLSHAEPYYVVLLPTQINGWVN